MWSVIGWVQDKANTAYEGVKSAVSAGSSVLSGMTNGFMQFWQGFAKIIDLSIPVSMLTKTQTLKYYARAQAGTLLRVGKVLLYRVGVRPLVNAGVHSVASNYPLVEAVAVNAVDVAAAIYFIRDNAHGMLDDTLYHSAIVKAASDDTEPKVENDNQIVVANRPKNPLVDACDHDVVEQTTSGIKSTIHFYGSRVLLRGLSNSFPYGNYIFKSLVAILHGRALLDEPLSEAGNCEKDRLDLLNANHAYAMGLGTSVLVATWVLEELISAYTGVDGIFIDLPVWAFVNNHLSAVTMLSRDNTLLPGKTPGADVFRPGRVFTDSVLDQTVPWVKVQLNQPDEVDWNDVLGQQPLRLIRSVMLDEDIDKVLLTAVNNPQELADNPQDSLRQLAKRGSVNAYLKTRGKDLLKVIDWVNEQRGKNTHVVVHNLPGWVKKAIPSFVATEEDKQNLAAIMSPSLTVPLRQWQFFLENALRGDPAAAGHLANRDRHAPYILPDVNGQAVNAARKPLLREVALGDRINQRLQLANNSIFSDAVRHVERGSQPKVEVMDEREEEKAVTRSADVVQEKQPQIAQPDSQLSQSVGFYGNRNGRNKNASQTLEERIKATIEANQKALGKK